MLEVPGVGEGRSTSLRKEGERSEIACKERSGVKAKRSERKGKLRNLERVADSGTGDRITGSIESNPRD